MIEDFRDLLRAFVDGRVRFLVVGAHALAAYGVPRVTGDLDLWIDADASNTDQVWNALLQFGAPLDSLGIKRVDLVTPDQVIQFGLPPFRVDLLTSISGVTFAEAWTHRLDGILFGVPVAFIGQEAFIRNKRATGRPKDLEDIRSLGDPTLPPPL